MLTMIVDGIKAALRPTFRRKILKLRKDTVYSLGDGIKHS